MRGEKKKKDKDKRQENRNSLLGCHKDQLLGIARSQFVGREAPENLGLYQTKKRKGVLLDQGTDCGKILCTKNAKTIINAHEDDIPFHHKFTVIEVLISM